MTSKRHLTRAEEFDILKLILDKFLWLGVFIMGFGFYRLVSSNYDFWFGLSLMTGGALILLIFIVILMREYHFMKG